MGYKRAVLKHKNHRISVELADSFLKQMKGLSHRKSLGKKNGMLFVFRSERKHGIWMLNMLFPIDILWINKEFRVIHIVEGAKPCKSVFECEIFKPQENAKYVLEVNEGIIDNLGIKKGDSISIV